MIHRSQVGFWNSADCTDCCNTGELRRTAILLWKPGFGNWDERGVICGKNGNFANQLSVLSQSILGGLQPGTSYITETYKLPSGEAVSLYSLADEQSIQSKSTGSPLVNVWKCSEHCLASGTFPSVAAFTDVSNKWAVLSATLGSMAPFPSNKKSSDAWTLQCLHAQHPWTLFFCSFWSSCHSAAYFKV